MPRPVNHVAGREARVASRTRELHVVTCVRVYATSPLSHHVWCSVQQWYAYLTKHQCRLHSPCASYHSSTCPAATLHSVLYHIIFSLHNLTSRSESLIQ